jgi:hypothetical protein
MKNLKFLLIVTFFAAFVSCNNDDNTSDSAGVIESTVRSGTWKITRFEDSGNNKTSSFAGYDFVFGASGTLTASSANNIFTGSWSIADDDRKSDDSDDLHFNINFDINNSFEDLSEDWHFVSYSASKIELIHISGGNGGTDYLTLERN